MKRMNWLNKSIQEKSIKRWNPTLKKIIMTSFQQSLRRRLYKMDTICTQNKCTGCGMCTNICPKQAIKLKEGLHGFVFPVIDESFMY